ncbi:MAG: fasciclin domain-containing protein, partial [Spiribacter salinus]
MVAVALPKCEALLPTSLPFNLSTHTMTTTSFSYVHRLVAVVLIGALGFLAACDDDTEVVTPPTEDDDTIAGIVADDDDFSTLLNLLQDEGLTDALGDEEATFTVFAPTNAAFGPYDLDAIAGTEGAVGEILRYHVVDGAAVAAGDLTDGQTIETLAGDELTVSLRDGNVFIDGSQVTQPDIEADNGIIHVIDRTLIGNQNLANVVAFVNETSALFGAVADAGLADAFVNADGWTVFG